MKHNETHMFFKFGEVTIFPAESARASWTNMNKHVLSASIFDLKGN